MFSYFFTNTKICKEHEEFCKEIENILTENFKIIKYILYSTHDLTDNNIKIYFNYIDGSYIQAKMFKIDKNIYTCDICEEYNFTHITVKVKHDKHIDMKNAKIFIKYKDHIKLLKIK